MNLTKERVSCHAQALEYMIECTLATVADFAMSQRPKVGEFRRQIRIAQEGMNWLQSFGRIGKDDCARVTRVIDCFKGDVAAWAKNMRERFYPDKPVKL